MNLNSKIKIKKNIISLFLFFLINLIFFPIMSNNLYCATIDIPYLINITQYNLAIGLINYFYLDFVFSGGLKYNIYLNFYYLNNETNAAIKPQLICAQIKDIFNIIDISVFHGLYKKIFEGPFIMSPLYTANFLTINSLSNFQYNYIIYGDGIDIRLKLFEEKLNLSIVGFLKSTMIQDYSIDIYFNILFIENIQFEFYGGTDKLQTFRAGSFLYFNQEYFKLKLNAGIHDISYYKNIFDLYLSFEQEIVLEQFSQSFIIFSKPSIYFGQNVPDYNDLQISFKVSYNNIYKTFYCGAISKLNLSTFSINQIELIPFFKILAGGVLFNISSIIQFLNTTTYFTSLTISFETGF